MMRAVIFIAALLIAGCAAAPEKPVEATNCASPDDITAIAMEDSPDAEIVTVTGKDALDLAGDIESAGGAPLPRDEIMFLVITGPSDESAYVVIFSHGCAWRHGPLPMELVSRWVGGA